jgi:hypothetical protein
MTGRERIFPFKTNFTHARKFAIGKQKNLCSDSSGTFTETSCPTTENMFFLLDINLGDAEN